MNAADVKAALRARHPATDGNGIVGAWTCVEEWRGIDLLAVSAWASVRPYPRYARIGYEVKVSRSDYRRELARGGKRAGAVRFCHEFYFAVPHGLLEPDEISWQPPAGFADEPAPLEPARCPGAFGAFCHRGRVTFGIVDRRSREQRAMTVGWARRSGRPDAHAWRGVDYARRYVATCPTCRGAGSIADPPATRAGAPRLWVPPDVGLVVVSPAGRAEVVKKAPRRPNPPPADGDLTLARIATRAGQGVTLTDAQLAELVRWVSVRPDERHAGRRR